MRAIDADALEKEGWSLHRTIRVDKNTSEYQTMPLANVPAINVGECEDTISRQQAIDFIDAGHLVNPNEPRWSDNEVVNFLKSRPPAQPDLSEYSDKLWRNAYERGKRDAQSEIIRCKECMHDDNCAIQYTARTGNTFFCGAAERREE